MNSYNYKDLELSKEQIKALRHAQNGEFHLISKEDLKFLRKCKLVRQTNIVLAKSTFEPEPTNEPKYAVTESGIMFLQRIDNDRAASVKHWLADKFIDFLALLVAIIALIRTF